MAGAVDPIKQAIQVYTLKQAMNNQQNEVGTMKNMLDKMPQQKIKIPHLGNNIDVRV